MPIWYKKKKPEIPKGSVRTRTRFAFFPVELDYPVNAVVWLRKYYTLEERGYISWFERFKSAELSFFEEHNMTPAKCAHFKLWGEL